MKRNLLLLIVLALQATALNANTAFVVSDIRVEGLQRISPGTVFTAMPMRVGDTADKQSVRATVRSLFNSGNFDDVRIAREGEVLVVSVVERPSISEINLEGNKAIESEALLKGLSMQGLAEGQVFKRSTLEQMRLELMRQYVSQGRYDAGIDTDVVSLPRNRVAVNININEGTTAAITQINIVGNTRFSDEELLELFELKSTGWWSWMSSNDKYSREKLSGDLEKLSSHYLDRGYVQFAIDSTQVAVNPDKSAVYITVNIQEGEQYNVGAVDLSGDLVVEEAQLKPYIFIQPGQVFSQALVTSSEEWLTKRLGNDGYNFAKVEGIPELDEEKGLVNIKFFVDPGKRTYVRRISFDGNVRTADEVLRREMRQMEGAPASSVSIDQSRVRLERLGFFKEAKVETLDVPGTDDLIDLTFSVEEQSSGSIGASIGFSQDSGILLGANIQQDNFLGSGKQVGIGLNKSDYMSSVNFSYVNPYYTEDGVSRGFSVYYRKADLDEINVSNYSTNTLGASVNFGYPIKETERLNFSLGYANTEIEAGFGAVKEIINSPRLFAVSGDHFANYFESQFDPATGLYTAAETLQPLYDASGNVIDPTLLADSSAPGFLDLHGDSFDNLTITGSWIQSTLNHGLLATRGHKQSLSLEVSVPGSDLEFYKLTYRGEIYFPIHGEWILRLRSELGYGDGFGDTENLPFFEHFYSGGFGSVRGFKSNTLGPTSTPAQIYQFGRAAIDLVDAADTECGGDADADGLCDSDGRVIGSVRSNSDLTSYISKNGELLTSVPDPEGDPFGGNILVESSIEMLFPLPFIKDRRSVRSAFFIDIGNVFSDSCTSTQGNCFDLDAAELRYSAGVGLSWITGFGPLTFSFAKPFNEGPLDETEFFQFSLGRSF